MCTYRKSQCSFIAEKCEHCKRDYNLVLGVRGSACRVSLGPSDLVSLLVFSMYLSLSLMFDA
jgi:hypothetical protein